MIIPSTSLRSLLLGFLVLYLHLGPFANALDTLAGCRAPWGCPRKLFISNCASVEDLCARANTEWLTDRARLQPTTDSPVRLPIEIDPYVESWASQMLSLELYEDGSINPMFIRGDSQAKIPARNPERFRWIYERYSQLIGLVVILSDCRDTR